MVVAWFVVRTVSGVDGRAYLLWLLAAGALALVAPRSGLVVLVATSVFFEPDNLARTIAPRELIVLPLALGVLIQIAADRFRWRPGPAIWLALLLALGTAWASCTRSRCSMTRFQSHAAQSWIGNMLAPVILLIAAAWTARDGSIRVLVVATGVGVVAALVVPHRIRGTGVDLERSACLGRVLEGIRVAARGHASHRRTRCRRNSSSRRWCCWRPVLLGSRSRLRLRIALAGLVPLAHRPVPDVQPRAVHRAVRVRRHRRVAVPAVGRDRRPRRRAGRRCSSRCPPTCNSAAATVPEGDGPAGIDPRGQRRAALPGLGRGDQHVARRAAHRPGLPRLQGAGRPVRGPDPRLAAQRVAADLRRGGRGRRVGRTRVPRPRPRSPWRASPAGWGRASWPASSGT